MLGKFFATPYGDVGDNMKLYILNELSREEFMLNSNPPNAHGMEHRFEIVLSMKHEVAVLDRFLDNIKELKDYRGVTVFCKPVDWRKEGYCISVYIYRYNSEDKEW